MGTVRNCFYETCIHAHAPDVTATCLINGCIRHLQKKLDLPDSK